MEKEYTIPSSAPHIVYVNHYEDRKTKTKTVTKRVSRSVKQVVKNEEAC